eukprot:2490721-Rhodomonas_salina.1
MAPAVRHFQGMSARSNTDTRSAEPPTSQEDSSTPHRTGTRPPPSCSPRDSTNQQGMPRSPTHSSSSQPPTMSPAGKAQASPSPQDRRTQPGKAPAPSPSRLDVPLRYQAPRSSTPHRTARSR